MSIEPLPGYDKWKLDNGLDENDDGGISDEAMDAAYEEQILTLWDRLYDEEEEEADRADEAREEEEDGGS